MSYQRWALMNMKNSGEKQLSTLQRLLQQSNDDDLDDDEIIPVNRSRLVQLDSMESEEEEIEDPYEDEEEECVSDDNEHELLLQLLLQKHKQALGKSKRMMRGSAFGKKKPVYLDLREKLNDIREEQDVVENTYNRSTRKTSRYPNQKGNNGFLIKRGNRFTEQNGGGQRRYMEQNGQRNFNDRERGGNNRFFEKRGGNRRFSDQRGRQRRFNDQRGQQQRGRNRFNNQGRNKWSNAEKDENNDDAEENEKEDYGGETSKTVENEEQSEKKEKSAEDDEYAMETQPSEMEALMGFSGFQTTKQN